MPSGAGEGACLVSSDPPRGCRPKLGDLITVYYISYSMVHNIITYYMAYVLICIYHQNLCGHGRRPFGTFVNPYSSSWRG